MKRFKLTLLTILFCSCLILLNTNYANAQPQNGDYDIYIVKSGDTLWKIAVKYKVGISEIIAVNPQFKNPNLIYPGNKVYIPLYSTVKAIEKEVVRLTNVQRQKYGLKPLTHNWELSRVARYKSKDMRDRGYFSHTSPTYGSPFNMMKNFGIKYQTAGENLAKGQESPQAVVSAWMRSAGHRQNILNQSFTQIGVGYAEDSRGRKYWTQMFIKPMSSSAPYQLYR